jgi:hypothetical protein
MSEDKVNSERIQDTKEVIEDAIRTEVEKYQQFSDVEIHAIKVDGKFNYVTKKLEYGIYADVREKGQIFLGMSS